MASPSASAATELSLLPLKPGDHLWRSAEGGGTWHGLYVGQFVLAPKEDGSPELRIASGADGLPQSVVVVAGGAVGRLPLAEFAGRLAGDSDGACVRLYTRRPRGRQEAVARALRAVGTRVDAGALGAFPELLPWWAIFDEAEALQPGLCATRAKAVRYRLTPKGDAPVQPALLGAVLAGGAVVSKGRVVLRGVRLMKVLRLTKAATVGWANLGSFIGGQIAASILDDGNASTAVATAAGGWAGGLAGGAGAAAAVSTVGVEGLGAGSVFGGLVVCSSLSFAGAIAGAGLAYGAKKAWDRQPPKEVDRTAGYHDCSLRLIGDADDVFNLFDATLEFPPEDAEFADVSPAANASPSGGSSPEGSDDSPASPAPTTRLAAAGWYAVRIEPGSASRLSG